MDSGRRLEKLGLTGMTNNAPAVEESLRWINDLYWSG